MWRKRGRNSLQNSQVPKNLFFFYLLDIEYISTGWNWNLQFAQKKKKNQLIVVIGKLWWYREEMIRSGKWMDSDWSLSLSLTSSTTVRKVDILSDLSFFKIIYLAVPGLGWDMQDLLSSLWHAGSLVTACGI